MAEVGFMATPLSMAVMNGGYCSGMILKGVECKPRLDESTVDHLRALLRQESEFYGPCKDYLATIPTSLGNPSEIVSEGSRRKLCEWCYEVVDHFGFDREAVPIALDYLDRTVALKMGSYGDGMTKKEFQLITVTSLYIAIKLHGEIAATSPYLAIKPHGETFYIDGPKMKLGIEVYVELSRGFFQVEVIEAMERNIIESLDWRLNPPTSLRFIANFLHLLPVCSINEHCTPHAADAGNIYDVARYLSELSVCVSDFSFGFKTSTIAYASILCALEALQETLPLPYDTRVKFLNDITEVTGIFPESKEVCQVRGMLKELCPSLFPGNNIPPAFFDRASGLASVPYEGVHQGDGNASPVCVADGPAYNSPSTSRKRSRTISETNAKPKL
jgi:lipoyl(octanoyl) transferase